MVVRYICHRYTDISFVLLHYSNSGVAPASFVHRSSHVCFLLCLHMVSRLGCDPDGRHMYYRYMDIYFLLTVLLNIFLFWRRDRKK